MNTNNYKTYMQSALELASKGWGFVSPNPMVGALIVKNEKVISAGYHKGPGREHAEAAAINSADEDLEGSTIIVNLEPCCFFGRTPPCTDAIIKSGIKRVVYGVRDPNKKVNGKGIQKLKQAGIEVIGPVMEKECRSFNRIYFHWVKTGMPYIISKVALSLDGKIATESGDSKWITGKRCRERMHYWRAGVDAVMVGAETVRTDDPRLSARGLGKVEQPRPIIVTTNGDIPKNRKIWKRGPMLLKGRRINWKNELLNLGKEGVTSILVEGGGKIHSQIIKKKLSNYMVASMSTKLIGGEGRDWLPGISLGKVKNSPRIEPDQILVVDNDIIIEGEVRY